MKRVMLNLSSDEADALLAVLWKVAGEPKHSRCGLTDHVAEKLTRAGATHPPYTGDTYGSVEFFHEGDPSPSARHAAQRAGRGST